jgi:hypothetical protein
MTFRAAVIPADNDYCARCGSYSLLPYHCDNCGNDLGPRPTLIPAEVQHHPRAVELLVNCAECGSILNAEICNHDERPFGKQILVTVDVRCLGCNARFGWVQTTHEEALRFWNTRAATSQPTAAPPHEYLDHHGACLDCGKGEKAGNHAPVPTDESVAREQAQKIVANWWDGHYKDSMEPNLVWLIKGITAAIAGSRPQAEQLAELDARIESLRDAWRRDIRAHQDGCPASFSNCVPDDCACGLTELRNKEMDAIASRSQGECTWMTSDDEYFWRSECGGQGSITNATPTVKRAEWCPFCGRPLREAKEGGNGEG